MAAMVFYRMPGAIPARYVRTSIQRDDDGELYALIFGNAGSVPADRFDVLAGLDKGKSLAKGFEAPFYIDINDDDWNPEWGALKDDFVRRD